MSIEEMDKYIYTEADNYLKEFEDYTTKVNLEKEIIDYHTKQYGLNYIVELNNDLKNLIKFKKSLKP